MLRTATALESPLSRLALTAGSPLYSLQQRLQPLGQRLAAVRARRWQQLILLLAAIWLVWSLARIVWLLMPWPAPVVAADSAPINVVASGVSANDSAKGGVDVEAMVGWKLFGDAGDSQSQPVVLAEVDADAAQESSLNLQLQGVMSARDPALARALILADGIQKQFAIGEQLPASGRVTLSRVLPDRIIIDNNGRAETVWLYDPSAMTGGVQPVQPVSPPAPGRAIDMRGDAAVTAAAAGYREQLFRDPASLSDVLQVSVERDGGRMIGYRVRPGRDAAQFERFGFKAGDVVTAINGVGLEDPQRALELYNQMRSATDATFTVRRGSEELTVLVSLESATQ